MATAARGADWPMWRCDAGRTASSPEELPAKLHLQWTRRYTPREQVWDDPLNNDLMPYDKVFEPVVAGGRMFVGFNDRNKLVALDVATGRQLWQYFTDGPVRFAPVVWRDRVFFSSDDGYLYCARAADGKGIWKLLAAPAAHKILGNKRLISAWPARGGPVERDGNIYFASSIWPMMGTFIYCIDAESGAVKWLNDGTSALYIKQPHSAPSFAGVAPQGALVATQDVLLVPGGRSVPAAFNRHNGQMMYFHINDGGKGNGGSLVMANETDFFCHTRYRGVRSFDLKSGKKGGFTVNEPVLDGQRLYASDDKKVRAYDEKKKVVWEIEADGSGDLIKAGSRLYAAGKDKIVAIELPKDKKDKPTIIWSHAVKGKVLRLLAAGGRLFAVTTDGRIMAFGEEHVDCPAVLVEEFPAIKLNEKAAATAKLVVEGSGAGQGYALCFGTDDGRLLEALVLQSDLHVIAVEPDWDKVVALRKRFDAAGLYGSRVTVQQGDPLSFKAPPYLAELIVLGRDVRDQYTQKKYLQTIYQSLRPYGGALWIPRGKTDLALAATLRVTSLVVDGHLPKAKMSSLVGGMLLVREGSLPGAASWTHQYGDVANSVKSNDTRVKLPLGILWFGGNSHMDVLPRHGHGPSEQVIGGRLIIEGLDSLSARDVYTGRVLWKRTIENLGTFGAYYTKTFKDTPLSTAYNQRHFAGANARGTNYIATVESVYVAAGSQCLVLDAKTGETKRTINLPGTSGKPEDRRWGFIGVYEDVLLAGDGFANYGQALGEKPAPSSIVDMSASRGLVAFDRHTGKVLWKLKAENSFLHNAIVAGGGRVYCLDRYPRSVEGKLKRRGKLDLSKYRIVALDARSGKKIWQTRDDIIGTWLGYSVKHDILLQAGARAGDRLRDEAGQGMITYAARDGKVRWKKLKLKYAGPCILHNETIITNTSQHSTSSGAINLLDGSVVKITNPLTGELEPWLIRRGKGCNTVVASENLLTFRDGAASYYDLTNISGTGSFGGFKSGCTSNLIVADGVLNAPDYTRSCSCAYQNQTSLAMIHMPDVDIWTVSQFAGTKLTDRALKRVGINLGAPGDRRATDGTLWLDFPVVGGASPPLSIKVEGQGHDFYRRDTKAVSGEGPAWIAASGTRNLTSITLELFPKVTSGPQITIAITEGKDDAEETKGGKMNLTSSDLELVEDIGKQQIGLRFRNIQLPRGAKIEKAAIQFTTDARSRDKTELKIYAEAADNAAAFEASSKNISSRATTAAVVRWKPKPWSDPGETGPEQRTPDLSALLKEVVNRKGWKPGGSLVFIIEGKGRRIAKSFDGDKKNAPRLIFQAEQKPGDKTPAVDPTKPAAKYTVRLHFAEPDGLTAGQRVFNVSLQGKKVLDKFDVAAVAGGPNRSVVKEFKGVQIRDSLVIEFSPTKESVRGATLCGIELVVEP
ncbi:MAG: PQQ-binding-like beta-propeller repeat protein [Planctomycetes bacterium]|nr:PQQ-binding-like beta-propeller repeat protein [Planctomycetota bacterium]